MFYEAVTQCTQMLRNVQLWLDKAEQHAQAKGFDVDILMTSRLAPDMQHLIYQTQSACDYVKAGAAWLSGQTPPKHADSEQTITELRARLERTISFVESISAEQYAGAEGRRVAMSWSPPGTVIVGADYLIQMVVPNVYFHVTIVYAILRHHGVAVGKMDYLGPLNWVPT